MDKFTIRNTEPDIRQYASSSEISTKKHVCKCCQKKFTQESYILHTSLKLNNKNAIFLKKTKYKKVYILSYLCQYPPPPFPPPPSFIYLCENIYKVITLCLSIFMYQEDYIILCESVGCCFNSDNHSSIKEHYRTFPEHRLNNSSEDVFVLPKTGIYGDLQTTEASQCPQCLKNFSSAVSLKNHKISCRGRGVIR